jgi:hypothetical protein
MYHSSTSEDSHESNFDFDAVQANPKVDCDSDFDAPEKAPAPDDNYQPTSKKKRIGKNLYSVLNK